MACLGTGLLPGPVQELHASDVTDSEVTLSWEPPTDGSNVTDYVIHYNKVDNTSMHETLLKLDNVRIQRILYIFRIVQVMQGTGTNWLAKVEVTRKYLAADC